MLNQFQAKYFRKLKQHVRPYFVGLKVSCSFHVDSYQSEFGMFEGVKKKLRGFLAVFSLLCTFHKASTYSGQVLKNLPNLGYQWYQWYIWWYGWWKKSCTTKHTWSLDPRAPHLTLVGKICHQSKEVEWLKSCTGAQGLRIQHWKGGAGAHVTTYCPICPPRCRMSSINSIKIITRYTENKPS